MATFEEALTRSLQCRICQGVMVEPKLLSCAHTFCGNCVRLLCISYTGDNDTLSCPVCHKTTVVKDLDASKLLTNLHVQALVSEVAEAHQPCTNCGSGEILAVSFCQECKVYLCNMCQEKHAAWEDMANHQVATVDDIKQGKLVPKKKAVCREHEPTEGDEACTGVCLTCSKVICNRCRVLEHDRQGHDVHDIIEYTSMMMNQIDALRDRSKASFESNGALFEQQQRRITDHMNRRKSEIGRSYEASVRKLTERKDILLNECDIQNQTLLEELDRKRADEEIQMTNIGMSIELVRNSLEAPLDGDTVAIQHSLCINADQAIERNNRCVKNAAAISSRCEQFDFEKTTTNYGLELGRVDYMDVMKLRCNAKLVIKNSMFGMAVTPDGRVAVGCKDGIEFYNSGGEMQMIECEDQSVMSLGLLSDGRYAIVDEDNIILLYSPEFDELAVRFKTLSKQEGGRVDLSVSGDDLLYICYRKTNTIQAFTPNGGQAVREIPCDGYEPHQICALKTRRDRLIVSSGGTVRAIDAESGVVKQEVSKEGLTAFPAVGQNDSILIAWVKPDKGTVLVTIIQYTTELYRAKTLITNERIQRAKRGWHYLQELSSGEIALCTTNMLYIFDSARSGIA